jgi:hypothetical protein
METFRGRFRPDIRLSIPAIVAVLIALVAGPSTFANAILKIGDREEQYYIIFINGEYRLSKCTSGNSPCAI